MSLSGSEIITYIADGASIAGFVGTLAVAYQTTRIKAALLRRFRIPESARDLQKHSTALIAALGDWPSSKNEVDAVLARLNAVAENTSVKLRRGERKDFARIIRMIDARSRSMNRLWLYPAYRKMSDADRLWDISNAVGGAIESLSQLNKDNKKRMH